MKITYDNATYDVWIIDDGTLDTVLLVDNIEHRFDGEYASYYRDTEGSLTYQGLKELAIQAIDTPFH